MHEIESDVTFKPYRIVWKQGYESSSWFKHAMYFDEDRSRIKDMLKYLVRHHDVERIVGERNASLYDQSNALARLDAGNIDAIDVDVSVQGQFD